MIIERLCSTCKNAKICGYQEEAAKVFDSVMNIVDGPDFIHLRPSCDYYISVDSGLSYKVADCSNAQSNEYMRFYEAAMANPYHPNFMDCCCNVE